MRPLEIAIPILLAIYLAWPLTRQPRPTVVTLLPALALLATLIHFFSEGYRWQMIPLYVLTPVLAIISLIGFYKPQRWTILASILTLILLAVSTVLPILLPVPRLPKPSGPYQVGTQTFVLTDAARKELYSGKDEPRKFMIQVWYPADPRPTDPIADFLHLPHFFLDHLALAKTDAYLNSPIHKPDSGGYPVIVFSHGWQGFSAQNSGQMIELASQGYVVIAMQHTYGARITVFPDGQVAMNNPKALPDGEPEAIYDPAARLLVNQWSGDIAFALDYMTKQNSDSASPFHSALDLNRIGVYGHSTGGGAAIQFCGTDPRCKAVLGLDPFMTPVSLEVLGQGLSQPAFFMFSQVWHDDTGSKNNRLFDEFYAHVPQSKGAAFIAGTRHYDFSDLPLLSPIAPQLGLKGPINGNLMVKIADTYILAFFDATLKGQSTDLFNGDFSAFPEVKAR
jgi:predicted dienelactone hydrolase